MPLALNPEAKGRANLVGSDRASCLHLETPEAADPAALDLEEKLWEEEEVVAVVVVEEEEAVLVASQPRCYCSQFEWPTSLLTLM